MISERFLEKYGNLDFLELRRKIGHNKISIDMTPEQQTAYVDAAAKAQHESWLNAERLSCRKRAMEYAVQIKIKDGCDIYSEADAIYRWLTKELE